MHVVKQTPALLNSFNVFAHVKADQSFIWLLDPQLSFYALRLNQPDLELGSL